MKNKIWLLQLPFVFLFTFAFLVTEMGGQGDLTNGILREDIFPVTRSISAKFTDLKFKLRGYQKPKSNVVVIDIDNLSIEAFGRWPWHRNVMAILIDEVFKAGAKVVGLDIVFSEQDIRVPEELRQELAARGQGDMADQFETDLHLAAIIDKHKDRLVMGYTFDATCSPEYRKSPDLCPIETEDALKWIPANWGKYAVTQARNVENFQPVKTPLMTALTYIPNIELFDTYANYAGYFNAFPDSDAYIRRAPMILPTADKKALPSLALQMARVGLGEELFVEYTADHKIKKLGFAKSGRTIPVNPMGEAEINFRGPGRTFTYIPAIDVMAVATDADTDRQLAAERQAKRALLKDAYVLVGLSAIGVYDMRAFPFDSNVPGVEGHASILDNILAEDFLVRGVGSASWAIMVFLMIAGAIAFGYATQRLESVPALILFIAVFTGIGLLDVKVFFQRNINWDTSFLYLELFAIFVFTVAVKYVIEERNKKFVRGAFAKYVAPAVVDSILKDPTKLTVGGEKKELTILFSDIRGFTTFSERMDAKALAAFLNDYLGIMTQIVFANEGTLDKYIGDAVMAFWGAPLDQPHHAVNCCRAAVQMMKALEENKERFKTQYGVEVNIGIGINSGAVNVGNMGSNQNFAYTVIGDHVNLASRLEGLTKAYGCSIVTTRFTFDDIAAAGDGVLPHRVLDFVKVKGKKKAVELIQVLDRELNPEGLRLFEEGRQLYQAQKWDEAVAKFEAANALLSPGTGQNDGPCEVYLERCRDFKAAPPAPDWDGSWEMHSK